ncbi:hypothetical protein B0H19DRAFT_1100130 [Mycena capillaripes]|nr:hypothetical protein B0H19DRAFT_1100130 [Mycena capillaripes]
MGKGSLPSSRLLALLMIFSPQFTALARAGKTPKGRAKKRILYNRRFVNVTALLGGKRRIIVHTESTVLINMHLTSFAPI